MECAIVAMITTFVVFQGLAGSLFFDVVLVIFVYVTEKKIWTPQKRLFPVETIIRRSSKNI